MRPLHILLAEDNQADVWLVRQALEEHRIPHRLYVVKDGAEAIAYVARLGNPDDLPCPDILLLDLNLPKADGTEVLREFRQHPKCAHTPVIVVTSSSAARDLARIGELGISSYFQKPVDLDEFLRLGAVVKEVVAAASV